MTLIRFTAGNDSMAQTPVDGCWYAHVKDIENRFEPLHIFGLFKDGDTFIVREHYYTKHSQSTVGSLGVDGNFNSVNKLFGLTIIPKVLVPIYEVLLRHNESQHMAFCLAMLGYIKYEEGEVYHQLNLAVDVYKIVCKHYMLESADLLKKIDAIVQSAEQL